MSQFGAADLVVASRRALLDALDALAGHRSALVLVGAQAIYLHTNNAPVALAEATKDSDIAIDPRRLGNDPLIEEAMRGAGFTHDQKSEQPGSWLTSDGIPVDLMVPERLAGSGSRRSGRVPPHDDHATRRAIGLEAAIIDNRPMIISALDPSDARVFEMNVAGPAALLVAKMHKLGERLTNNPNRLVDKDAHDVYRLLVVTQSQPLAVTLGELQAHPVCGEVTVQALRYLASMFAAGPDAMGARMAGRAEELVGDPANVSASAAVLAADLLQHLSSL